MRNLARYSFTYLLCLTFLLAGCAVKLSPSYDQAVVDGLSQANLETMTLLANVATGTQAASYPQRAAEYTTLIGKLDALAIWSAARPQPALNDALKERLAKRGITFDESSGLPSTNAIKKISDTIAMMRKTDQEQGMTAFEVAAFKGQVAIFLQQAITYENFLRP